MSSRIGSISSLGTNMLPLTVSSSSASCTNSEPMPISRPLRVEQRRAAPLGMRRRREQGLVEQVFPIAGKLSPRENTRSQRVAASAVADDEHVVVQIGRFEVGAWNRAQVELAQRQYEPQARHLVVCKRMARNDVARMRRQPDRFRFGDQVADRQHEAIIIDDDAVAAPFGAEDRRGKRVFGNLGPNCDDRTQRRREVEWNLAAFRLQFGGECPVRLVCHAAKVHSSCTAAHITRDAPAPRLRH